MTVGQGLNGSGVITHRTLTSRPDIGLGASYVYAPRVTHPGSAPREPETVDWCTTEQRATELGQAFLHNCESGGARGYKLDIVAARSARGK